MPTTTPTKKGRGKGRLKPQHLEYVKLIQSGMPRYEAAIQAGFNEYTAQKAKIRIEGMPEVKKLIELAHVNAQLEGQYGLKEAVSEVDRAITFAYEQENPNAIAKLLEHKSKLYGLLVEKVDIKTTYIDLKGALEQAKERVLIQLNSKETEQNRGLSAPALLDLAPALPKGSIHDMPATPAPIPTDPTASTSRNQDEIAPCLHQNSPSITEALQAEAVESEGNQRVRETSSDKLYYVNSEKQDDNAPA